jgi:hypothetical protein
MLLGAAFAGSGVEYCTGPNTWRRRGSPLKLRIQRLRQVLAAGWSLPSKSSCGAHPLRSENIVDVNRIDSYKARSAKWSAHVQKEKQARPVVKGRHQNYENNGKGKEGPR